MKVPLNNPWFSWLFMQSSEKMVVAITGATGFIGSKLVQRLVAGMNVHHLNVVPSCLQNENKFSASQDFMLC
jgi:nucleoside-diphosphate-sugar epimerase